MPLARTIAKIVGQYSLSSLRRPAFEKLTPAAALTGRGVADLIASSKFAMRELCVGIT
jgi:hypothetical protein